MAVKSDSTKMFELRSGALCCAVHDAETPVVAKVVGLNLRNDAVRVSSITDGRSSARDTGKAPIYLPF
jgi:hypothetical protein